MAEKQIFCGAEICSPNCPVYNRDAFDFISLCKIIRAKVNANNAKQEAYDKMKEYYSLKIEGDK